MNKQFPHISHKHLFDFFIVLALVSVIYSKFLLSVSLISMFVLSIFNFGSFIPFRLRWRAENRQNLYRFFRHWPCVALSLIFAWCLLSGFWSENLDEWLKVVRLKLPFLIVPFIFLSHSKLSYSRYVKLHLVFVLICVLVAMITLGEYLIDFSEITESIKKGRSIPSPISRPHFSTLLALGLWASLAMQFDTRWKIKRTYRIILWIFSTFLFVILHVFAIRTGLVIAYLGLILIPISWLIRQHKYVWAFGIFLVLMSLPVISYLNIPSFKNKIDYSVYDMKQYWRGEGMQYSDSERIYSIQAGWHVFKKYPILGSGIGDLREECIKYYQSFDNKVLQFKDPHNQFIHVLAAYGLLGIIVFIMGIYSPLFNRKHVSNIYLMGLYLAMSILFLVESPLERSNMIAFFLLFLSLGLFLEEEEASRSS